MNNQQIAMQFITCFCASDIEALAPLLADDLKFKGTLYSYNSAADYLQALKNDPPEIYDYKILSITESDESVAVFYEYCKANGDLMIAQLFRMQAGKIGEIILIFNADGV